MEYSVYIGRTLTYAKVAELKNIVLIPVKDRTYRTNLQHAIDTYDITNFYKKATGQDVNILFVLESNLSKIQFEYELFNDFWVKFTDLVKKLPVEQWAVAQYSQCSSLAGSIIRELIKTQYSLDLWLATGITHKIDRKKIFNGLFKKHEFLFDVRPLQGENYRHLAQKILNRDLTTITI